MSIQMIIENDLKNKVRNNEMTVCSVIITAFADPHMPINAGRYLRIDTDLIKKRHEFGVLEIGDVREIDVGELVDNLIAVVIPDPTDKDNLNYETLRKCYMNALECAYMSGSEQFVLPPFYAGSIAYNADIVYAALLDAADSFLSRYGNTYDIYVSIRSGSAGGELFRAYNSELKYGMDAFMKNNPDDFKEKLEYMKENANPTEKALRLAAKWNKAETEKLKKEQADFLAENPHMGNDTYRHEIFVKYITDKVGNGREYSQNAFAAKCGLNVSVINRLIKGTRVEVKKETALKIAVALELKERAFKRFILCSGSSFPCNEADKIILKYVKEGNFDYESIEKEIEKISKNKDKNICK